jgi:hypothetical protein
MKQIRFLFIPVFLLSNILVQSKPLVLTDKELASPPPRIIRTCCSFGNDVGIVVVPFVKVTETSYPGKLGPHKYLGSAEEGNGIIYTKRGGFIDMAHLRDQADWTAYLYSLILHNRDKGSWEQVLGYEGGVKTLHIQVDAESDSADILLLAGRIAYDLSIWHEIATWFGTRYIPLLPEKFSSFSVEDPYSNLTGVTLGMKAIQSNLPYEQAMTELVSSTLNSLGAVQTEEETHLAMESVLNQWWTRDIHLPRDKMMLERELNVYSQVSPLLVPSLNFGNNTPMVLDVPQCTMAGEPLSDFYSLEFKLNYRFPYRKMFPDERGRVITQENFDTLIHVVGEEMEKNNIHPDGVTGDLSAINKKDKKPKLNRLRLKNSDKI